jgi:hypothetical protein
MLVGVLNGHFAQINLCNLVVIEQRFRFAAMNNAAAVHHPRAVGDLQRQTGVLLDQQQRNAALAQGDMTAKMFSTISGARPIDGSSRISRRGG